jgi:hypothetical protein
MINTISTVVFQYTAMHPDRVVTCALKTQDTFRNSITVSIAIDVLQHQSTGALADM